MNLYQIPSLFQQNPSTWLSNAHFVLAGWYIMVFVMVSFLSVGAARVYYLWKYYPEVNAQPLPIVP